MKEHGTDRHRTYVHPVPSIYMREAERNIVDRFRPQVVAGAREYFQGVPFEVVLAWVKVEAACAAIKEALERERLKRRADLKKRA